MQILTGIEKKPVALAFSPDGRYLAGGGGQAFHLWNLAAGLEPLWALADWSIAQNFTFSPEGTSILHASRGYIYRYDVLTGATVHPPIITELPLARLTPDGRSALAAMADASGVLRIKCSRNSAGYWTGGWQNERAYYPAHDWHGYRSLLFSDDGTLLARVYGMGRGRRQGAKAGIEVLDVVTGTTLAEWAGALSTYARQGAVSPRGKIVMLRDRALYAIDAAVADSDPIKRLNSTPKHFTSVAFSRDGRWLATTSNDTTATIWNTTTWEVQRRYEWQIGRLRTVCFVPDGLRCAAGSDTGQIVVWDLDD